eukprot:3571266-Prorocentrum_lima.AAC.1
MRAHVIHDMLGANLLNIEYAPSQENPADALTKGLTATVHRKAKLLPVSYTHLRAHETRRHL